MSRKAFAQIPILILVLLAFLAIPGGVQAGGLCGGTWVVDPGETLEKIAATCGITVSAIYAANPGISASLSAGQTLVLPGSNPGNNPNPGNPVPPSFSGIYIVQYGDTFSGIASRFGVSVSQLWVANPQIWDINVLYVGQAIHVPASSGVVPVPSFPETPAHLSYSEVPLGAPRGKVQLSNQANADVYVSLQGTTRDGLDVINEYTVKGTMTVRVPTGWYTYVAWVGGQKFVGQFNLSADSNPSITFFSKKVVVE